VRWIAAVAWGALILLSAATPLGSGETSGGLLQPLLDALGLSPAAMDLVHRAFRTVVHVVAYAIFALLVRRALRGRPRPASTALLAALALALVDEGIQLFVPGRGADLADVALDLGGAAAALLRVGAPRPAPSAPTA
jgi:VanZ family protein